MIFIFQDLVPMCCAFFDGQHRSCMTSTIMGGYAFNNTILLELFRNDLFGGSNKIHEKCPIFLLLMVRIVQLKDYLFPEFVKRCKDLSQRHLKKAQYFFTSRIVIWESIFMTLSRMTSTIIVCFIFKNKMSIMFTMQNRMHGANTGTKCTSICWKIL